MLSAGARTGLTGDLSSCSSSSRAVPRKGVATAMRRTPPGSLSRGSRMWALAKCSGISFTISGSARKDFVQLDPFHAQGLGRARQGVVDGVSGLLQTPPPCQGPGRGGYGRCIGRADKFFVVAHGCMPWFYSSNTSPYSSTMVGLSSCLRPLIWSASSGVAMT